MKKLKLQIEELCVDSFDAGAPQEVRGTVEGAGAAPSYILFCVPTPGTRLTCCPCTPAYD